MLFPLILLWSNRFRQVSNDAFGWNNYINQTNEISQAKRKESG